LVIELASTIASFRCGSLVSSPYARPGRDRIGGIAEISWRGTSRAGPPSRRRR
jgi:hypothetical protein